MQKKAWYKEDSVIIGFITLVSVAAMFALIFFQEVIWTE